MICIYDSGIGGLSIAHKIHEQYGVKISYVSDYEGFPYGEKDEAFVMNRCEYIANKVLSKYPEIKVMIIACNTASTVSLDHLRIKFQIPFIGVVPAIKPAAKLSQQNAVVLLATKATNSRKYTDQLIHDFAKNTKVIKISAPDLVLEAEKKPKDRDQSTILKYANIINQHPLKPDVIILGCTHYTFLKKELSKHCPNIKIIDSVNAIVKRLTDVIKISEIPSGKITLLTTKEIPNRPTFKILD